VDEESNREDSMVKVVVRRRRVVVLQIALALVFASLAAIVASPAQAAYPGGNDLIAFESGFELYVMPADGSTAPVRISPKPAGANFFETDPAFSPDGTMIAFSRSNPTGGADVWVSPFDPASPVLPGTGSWTKVTSGADGQPTWSPDGTKIAFERAITWSPTISNPPLRATSADATGLVLTDTGANFNTAQVTAGMDVKNVTDGGSTGKVSSVDSNTKITLQAPLTGGTTNKWAVGDTYEITSTRLQVF